MTTTDLPNLPGRLGNPDSLLSIDPRADPRMVAKLAQVGMDVAPAEVPVNGDSPIEALREFCRAAEPGYDQMFDILYAGLQPVDGVDRTTEVINGVDGNDINLYIHRPTGVDGPLPAVYHTHGGGMVILKASDPGYVHWRDCLAATGMVVVGVEFRNGGGALGDHPFPAGLNDCFSGLQWLLANKADLGVGNVVLSGESGGGNLAIATGLKAKAEGVIDQVAGIYAQCPYISNAYSSPPAELPSLFENDNYFLNVAMMGALARVYDPDGTNATNPMAWPYHASPADLVGMPPHVVSVNELDPLRDEGLAYYRKLLAAGVSASSRTVNGTCHAGDCLFPVDMPEVYQATVNDIHSFAKSL